MDNKPDYELMWKELKMQLNSDRILRNLLISPDARNMAESIITWMQVQESQQKPPILDNCAVIEHKDPQ